MVIAVTLVLVVAALATQQRTIWLLHLRVKRLESATESPSSTIPTREQLDRIYAVVLSEVAASLAEEDEDDEALSATKH